jgi:hypothetical protein
MTVDSATAAVQDGASMLALICGSLSKAKILFRIRKVSCLFFRYALNYIGIYYARRAYQNIIMEKLKYLKLLDIKKNVPFSHVLCLVTRISEILHFLTTAQGARSDVEATNIIKQSTRCKWEIQRRYLQYFS